MVMPLRLAGCSLDATTPSPPFLVLEVHARPWNRSAKRKLTPRLPARNSRPCLQRFGPPLCTAYHCPMARPRGEIRQVLFNALREGPASTTRELAARAGVGITAAMDTLNNMVKAGEVVVLHSARRPGVKRPVPVYSIAPATDPCNEHNGAALQSALNSMTRSSVARCFED